MTEPNQTIRVWTKTLLLLRHIHAYTGEPMVVIVDRLAKAELERVARDQARELEKIYVGSTYGKIEQKETKE